MAADHDLNVSSRQPPLIGQSFSDRRAALRLHTHLPRGISIVVS
jgi:hypothetical protein